MLAQVLAAATYPDDIPDAARWADGHHYLTGDRLRDAIVADHLPWDPSVEALLPFPSEPWEWTWANRRTYVHPYTVRRYAGQRPLERHELKPDNDHPCHARRSDDRRHS